MTRKEALKILRWYQKWRKGDIDDYCRSPKQITTALNIAIKALKMEELR
jgi:hypothetical protein